METVLLGSAIIGGAMDIMGRMVEAQAQAEASLINAQIADENAELSLSQSREEERRTRLEGGRLLGNIRASYGASGVRLDGTPMDFLADNAAVIESDALAIREQGVIQARRFRMEADQHRRAAGYAQTGAVLGAIGAGVRMGAKMGGAF